MVSAHIQSYPTSHVHVLHLKRGSRPRGVFSAQNKYRIYNPRTLVCRNRRHTGGHQASAQPADSRFQLESHLAAAGRLHPAAEFDRARPERHVAHLATAGLWLVSSALN